MKTLLTTLLSFIVLSASATVYNSNGTVQNIQAIHNNQAVDGDTITVPAGTFSWTVGVKITKGITLQGQTTISGAGTATPIINDATVILDNIPRANFSGIVAIHVPPGKSVRMTGLTFDKGVVPKSGNFIGAFPIGYAGTVASESYRIDHCHFKPLNQNRHIWIQNWTYGVIDHNVFEYPTGSPAIFLQAHTWGGTGKIQGFGSYEDYPWFGTNKFFFVEDNSFFAIGGLSVLGGTDGDCGGRLVWRHNYMKNGSIHNHGTEGATRGGRAYEVYKNVFEYTIPGSASAFRSGTALFHDNEWKGTASLIGGISLSNFRTGYIRPNSGWGISDGTSPFDANDTDGAGHFTEGQPPYSFYNGTASSTTAEGTVRVSGNPWTPNQWVNYSIHHNTRTSAYGSLITSNTSNTITYATGSTGSQRLIFNAGDTFKIHRVLIIMDQCGRGKTDVMIPGDPPVLQSTGQPGYPHPQLEPYYGWNNKRLANNTDVNIGGGAPTTKVGTDYFNLGSGLLADTTPVVVSSRYTAALNGVGYTGTFRYPHPLVIGAQSTPATPTVTTNPATNIASFAAALNGSVNPRGSTTTVRFQWGTTTSYGHTTSTQTQTGNTSRLITANISGLSASRLYHFRIVATNGGGTSFGSDRTFTTLSATGPPVVTTNPATNITTSSARLNGTLNPHGLTTTVRFQWGTTTSYGHTTPMQTQTGNTYRNIPVNISGLSASRLYHFRIVATNSAGTRFGIDRTFKTP